MKLTNNMIYKYAKDLIDAFNDKEQKLPIKINFYLQKNKNILMEKAQEIEEARINIAREYGELDSQNGQYIIPAEKMAEAQKELIDLFDLEQEVQIYTVNIDSLSEDLSITTAQMEAIMFMVE